MTNKGGDPFVTPDRYLRETDRPMDSIFKTAAKLRDAREGGDVTLVTLKEISLTLQDILKVLKKK
jgi:hypothetical protein